MFIYYECTSVTARNGCPMTCLDLAQNVVRVKSAGAHCDKMAALYSQTAL